jgi:hypothetical protein
VYHILEGSLQLTLSDGLTQPVTATAGRGYMFVVRPHNYVGLLNTSLVFVHSLRERHGGGGADVG